MLFKIITYRRWKKFWETAFQWFSDKFEAIASSIDFTPVEEGIADVKEDIADVKGDVADVKSAVENIDFSALATEANATSNKNAIIAAMPSVPTVQQIQSGLATEANATTNKQAILAKIGTPAGGQATDLFAAIKEGGGDSESAQAVKSFFGLVSDGETVKVVTEDGGEEVVVPVELATEQEVKDINDDVMGALYGYGKVAVTIHSLMRTGAETTQDLASVIYVDPEETWAENGYPTLYDDEGEPIDTTTNPAAGDEVFNYQIQSES